MFGIKEGKKLTKYISDYVIFDLETTGFSPENDQITEVSAVKVIGGQVVDEFSTLVNPRKPIPWQVSKVTGIYDDMVCDKPCIDCVLDEFFKFVGELTLVGHNINSFDMKFIYNDCLKYWGQIPDNDYIDTLRMAKILLPDLKSRKLVDLAEYYGISSEGAHRALNDCRMNQKVFEMLGKEISKASNRPVKRSKPTKQAEDKISRSAKKATTESTGRTEADKKALIDDLFGTNRNHGIRSSEQKTLKCPKCGNLLQKRSGKFGEFLGCTGYPNCRYTRNC